MPDVEHAHDGQIIIGPDGSILAAWGLPAVVMHAHLEECEALAPEIREAGRTLLHQLRHSSGRVAVQTMALGQGGGTLQLVAIEAVPIRRTPTDVRALLASKLGVLASQAANVDVTLSVESAADMPPTLQVDPEKLAWAVTTIVGNGLRYMQSMPRRSRGGTIAVRAAFDTAHAELAVQVKDDGPGVSPETVARLFSRDGLNVRGAGLALLLIADVCAAHGGRVTVHSSTGASDHGTDVRMAFAVPSLESSASSAP